MISAYESATLLYRESRDKGDIKTLWENCKGFEETITLVKTSYDTIIGCYCPVKIEDTTNMKDKKLNKGYKSIKIGAEDHRYEPWLFYFFKDKKLEIMYH